MFGKKRLGKIHKVGDDVIVCIRPKAGKLKTVAGFLGVSAFAAALLFDMSISCCVAVVFGMSTVGDNKNLHIFK